MIAGVLLASSGLTRHPAGPDRDPRLPCYHSEGIARSGPSLWTFSPGPRWEHPTFVYATQCAPFLRLHTNDTPKLPPKLCVCFVLWKQKVASIYWAYSQLPANPRPAVFQCVFIWEPFMMTLQAGKALQASPKPLYPNKHYLGVMAQSYKVPNVKCTTGIGVYGIASLVATSESKCQKWSSFKASTDDTSLLCLQTASLSNELSLSWIAL